MIPGKHRISAGKLCISPGKQCISAGKHHIIPGKHCISAGKHHIIPGKHRISAGKHYISACGVLVVGERLARVAQISVDTADVVEGGSLSPARNHMRSD